MSQRDSEGKPSTTLESVTYRVRISIIGMVQKMNQQLINSQRSDV